MHTSVEHGHASNWACAHFQLSTCTNSVEHMHTSHLHISMCTVRLSVCMPQLSMCTLQLSMCTHPIEHTHAFRWACACVTPTHQHIHTSVEYVRASLHAFQKNAKIFRYCVVNTMSLCYLSLTASVDSSVSRSLSLSLSLTLSLSLSVSLSLSIYIYIYIYVYVYIYIYIYIFTFWFITFSTWTVV